MAEDEAITFLSGKNLPPIFHNKYPYYERLKAGEFYPNPNHPPIDRITMRGFWGNKTIPVRRVSVPENMRHFPQYQDGSMLVCQRRSKIRPCGGVKVCQYGYA